MELLQTLVSQLNISEEQASGGAGLLFKLAQSKLNASEFNQVANAVPGVHGFISSAPEPDGLAGALGGLASAFGGNAGQLGNLASLASGFSKLDLDANMISKFIPVILMFVQAQGGDDLKNLLEKVLKQ